MQNFSTLVKGLEFKTRQLADRYHEAKKQMDALEIEKKQLESKLLQQQEIINELETKIHTLKITKSIHKGKETADAKKRINEMLRELDKCIDLLKETPI